MNLRAATGPDIPAIRTLITDSAIVLSRGFYTDAQAAALTEQVFGVDTQLIDDGTYFVIEEDDEVVAAGRWSRRGTLFDGDQAKHAHGGASGDPLLDPACDPARIRAFFVSPRHARRGLGSRLMRHCAAAAWSAGFRRLTIADGLCAPLVNMSRPLIEPTL